MLKSRRLFKTGKFMSEIFRKKTCLEYLARVAILFLSDEL